MFDPSAHIATTLLDAVVMTVIAIFAFSLKAEIAASEPTCADLWTLPIAVVTDD